MKKIFFVFFTMLIFNYPLIGIKATPLDIFLETHRAREDETNELELSLDHSITSNQFKSGDYRGGHIRGAMFVGQRLRFDGSYWERNLDTGDQWNDIISWQVGTQWQFLDPSGIRPGVALRFSLWSDSTERLTKASYTFPGIGKGKKVTDIRALDVEDRQQQLNLIASWQLNPRWDASLFSGIGRSRISFTEVFAKYKGCDYRWTSPTAHMIVAKITPADARKCSLQEVFFEDLATQAPGPDMDVAYQASYLQLGANLDWHREPWRVRVGYQWQSLKREVDDAIIASGKTIYKTNHILATEFSYHLTNSLLTFLRFEYMLNQTVGELPLLYNAYTASRFNKDYGLMALGVKYVF